MCGGDKTSKHAISGCAAYTRGTALRGNLPGNCFQQGTVIDFLFIRTMNSALNSASTSSIFSTSMAKPISCPRRHEHIVCEQLHEAGFEKTVGRLQSVVWGVVAQSVCASFFLLVCSWFVCKPSLIGKPWDPL